MNASAANVIDFEAFRRARAERDERAKQEEEMRAAQVARVQAMPLALQQTMWMPYYVVWVPVWTG